MGYVTGKIHRPFSETKAAELTFHSIVIATCNGCYAGKSAPFQDKRICVAIVVNRGPELR